MRRAKVIAGPYEGETVGVVGERRWPNGSSVCYCLRISAPCVEGGEHERVNLPGDHVEYLDPVPPPAGVGGGVKGGGEEGQGFYTDPIPDASRGGSHDDKDEGRGEKGGGDGDRGGGG